MTSEPEYWRIEFIDEWGYPDVAFVRLFWTREAAIRHVKNKYAAKSIGNVTVI